MRSTRSVSIQVSTQGALTYGECYLPGASTDEVLISCHVCHPSLCNDNLSGIAVATFLASNLAEQDRRYSYRLFLIPGSIGSITWLATHEQVIPRIKHGFVSTGVGDAGPLTYKRSRRGDAEIDHVMAQVSSRPGNHTCSSIFSHMAMTNGNIVLLDSIFRLAA